MRGRKRSWGSLDPQPSDKVDLIDNLGEVWVYEGELHPCPCGEHACTFDGNGWWSPTLGIHKLQAWAQLFEPRHDGRTADRLHELTEDERRELCREMFS